MGPLVSILIPTYNREKYVETALRSAREQTYRDVEVVVVDNASTDTTLDVVERASREDSRVRVHVNETNLGMGGNFTRCLELARGEYVKYLMSDDVLAPRNVERLLAPMLAEPGVVLATSKRDVIDAAGNRLPDFVAMAPLFGGDTLVDGVDFADMSLRANQNLIGEPTTVLFRRDAVAPGGDPFELDGESFPVLLDMALWLKILANGSAAYIREPLSCFRWHDDQAQKDPSLGAADNKIEWLALLRGARRLGFLADPGREIEALGAFVRQSAAVLTYPGADPRGDLAAGVAAAGEEIASAARRARIEAESATAGAAFPCSVVIPLRDDGVDPSAVLDLLTTLSTTTPAPLYEAVLVPGRLPDATAALLDALDGDLRVLDPRPDESRIDAIARGAQAALGRHVVVLDPRHRLSPGWLMSLLDGTTGRRGVPIERAAAALSPVVLGEVSVVGAARPA